MKKQTKQNIAHTAFKMFLENGYQKTSLRDIANECNTTHVNILYHYKNKSDLGLLLQETYVHTVGEFIKTYADEFSIEPSIKYYSLYWMLHYTFMLEHPNFARFYCEFESMNRQSIALSKLRPDGYMHMTSTFTGMEIAYDEPEITLNMHLLVEADMQIIILLSKNEIDISEAMSYYLKNSLKLLVNHSMGPQELNEIVNDTLNMKNDIKPLTEKIEQKLFMQTAE